MKPMETAGAIALIELQIKALDEDGTEQVAHLKQEVERLPEDAETHFDLGMAYLQMALTRNYLITERSRMLLQENMEDASQLDFSGTAPIYQLAIGEFERTLALNPDYYGVQCQLGITYGNLEQYDKAIACYRQALEDDPEDFSAAYYLGITYKDLGQKEEALRYLQMAQQLNPDDEMLQEDLAELQ